VPVGRCFTHTFPAQAPTKEFYLDVLHEVLGSWTVEHRACEARNVDRGLRERNHLFHHHHQQQQQQQQEQQQDSQELQEREGPRQLLRPDAEESAGEDEDGAVREEEDVGDPVITEVWVDGSGFDDGRLQVRVHIGLSATADKCLVPTLHAHIHRWTHMHTRTNTPTHTHTNTKARMHARTG